MLAFFAQKVITPLLPFYLSFVAATLYYKLGFFPFSHLKTAASSLFRNRSAAPWRALAVALAGTLGVGNIIGVAYAITAGGAGALFWMWISALLAMILKYGETVLAIQYRINAPQDKRLLPALQHQRGGAMYYIPHKPLAIAFAILCLLSSFTVGNLLQTNAVGEAFSHSFSLSPYLVGLLFSLLTLTVIWRGITRITSFCTFVIPFLSLVYLLMCATVLIKNLQHIPSLFSEIFREAFSFRAISGAGGGIALFQAMKIGFSKGLITNEAGCGTAPIAHASAKTDSGVKQGLLGIIEVFFDTVVLCGASGLVLLLAHRKAPDLNGFSLVSLAFTEVFGKIGDYVIACSLFFFVVATLVGWSFYGRSALEYFTENKVIGRSYLLLFSAVAFIGTLGRAEIFWHLADITVGLMTFINTGYIFYFRSEIKKETHLFLQKETRSGH